MKLVMGAMNGVWLLDLMNAAKEKCSKVTATVAYATSNNPFFENCLSNKIYLDFIGLLDEDSAVAISVLQKLIDAGPLAANPRLIKGNFHSKIIWWHGYGAYIGSANLTDKAWFSNVECGVFYEESEIIGTQIQQDLELQFDYLRVNSSPVTRELIKSLSSLRTFETDADKARQKLQAKFDDITKGIPAHIGLAAYGPSTKTTAFTRFTTEWNETLELLRGLAIEFKKINKRPVWVDQNADPTVHFDQFLHAYYYVRVRDENQDEETVKSVELVNKSYETNRKNPVKALQDEAEWWSSLKESPYGEDVFIRETAPNTREMFSKERLASWTLDDFKNVFFNVHAFRMHARQVQNKFFGLPAGHKETVKDRSDRLATWLWEQPRESGQAHIKDLLMFLIWGSTPANMSERLWLAITDTKWHYERLGPSSLGEAVGWARSTDFPPRNNRTNKALKALGHDVRLFSD